MTKRLEEIDKNKAFQNDDVVIELQEYKWLIQQAEKAERLENQLETALGAGFNSKVRLLSIADNYRFKAKVLEERNYIYKQALEGAKSELEAHYRLGGTSDNGALEIIDRALEKPVEV